MENETMTMVLPFKKDRAANRVYGSEIVKVLSKGDSEGRVGVIKDISSSGARIRVYDAASLAPHVRLSAQAIGSDVAATIRWRRKSEIGVKFDAPSYQRTVVGAP